MFIVFCLTFFFFLVPNLYGEYQFLMIILIEFSNGICIDEIFIDQMHYKLIDLSLNHSAYYQNVGSQNVSTLRRHQ